MLKWARGCSIQPTIAANLGFVGAKIYSSVHEPKAGSTVKHVQVE